MSKKDKGEKKFGTSLFGFNKVDVSFYLESLIKSYNDSIWEKDNQIKELKDKIEELEQQNKELKDELNTIKETKDNIANTFIEAQRNADKIIDEARKSAALEKNKLEVESETLRELIIDRKMVLRDLRDAARRFGDDLEERISDYVKDFTNKIDIAVSESEDKFISEYIKDLLTQEESEATSIEDINENSDLN